MTSGGPAAEPSASAEALYPFLYGGESDLGTVLAQVRESTVAKVEEISALRLAVLERFSTALDECGAALAASFLSGGRLFTFGNGGSSTDAGAIAQLFVHPPEGRALPVLSLSAESAVVTALSNDVGFEVVFARQLGALGRDGDVALGVSTSGGSENVVRAFREAHRIGMTTVGFAGYEGGQMADGGLVDHLFVVPSASVHRIQEAQTTLYQTLWKRTQSHLR